MGWRDVMGSRGDDEQVKNKGNEDPATSWYEVQCRLYHADRPLGNQHSQPTILRSPHQWASEGPGKLGAWGGLA